MRPLAQDLRPFPPPDDAIADLLALYAELDRRLDALGLRCRACGRCCDFARNDYQLYASYLERALVVARHGLPQLTPDGLCRFLADGRCSIHPSRPLGCRTFFCDPAYKPHEQTVCHAFQRRLRALSDRHALAWEYALFFSPLNASLLAGAGDGGSPAL